MEVELKRVSHGQRDLFFQMMNLYCYDFSEFLRDDIDEYGCYKYTYRYTDDLFANDSRYPFFVYAQDKPAGFVIVKKGGYRYIKDAGDDAVYSMDEFFIMKKYRGNGIGRFVARQVFDRYAGMWEVCQLTNNMPARKFWKSVIAEYTHGDYQVCGSEKDWHVGFIFCNMTG